MSLFGKHGLSSSPPESKPETAKKQVLKSAELAQTQNNCNAFAGKKKTFKTLMLSRGNHMDSAFNKPKYKF